MDELAKAVLLAAKYNQEGCMPLDKAADKAAEDVGFDERGTEPVYLLLKNSWNESLDWANKY